MDRDLLPHLPVVLAVARHGGFASAAAALGMSASAASHAVARVEDRLGAVLFARTTRSVALSDAGAALIARLGPALDELAASLEHARARHGQVTGTLRLSASRVAILMALPPLLAALSHRHPQLTVELLVQDGFVDIVADGLDAGIRLGEAIAHDMVSVRLTGPFQAGIVAAPAYLAAHGTPGRLADLSAHRCIGYRLVASGARYDWDLQDQGRAVQVPTQGPVVLSDATLARELALAGLGLAYLFQPLVAQDLAAGRLVAVLPECWIEEGGLFVYFPRRAALAPKLRAFLDVARALNRAAGATAAAAP